MFVATPEVWTWALVAIVIGIASFFVIPRRNIDATKVALGYALVGGAVVLYGVVGMATLGSDWILSVPVVGIGLYPVAKGALIYRSGEDVRGKKIGRGVLVASALLFFFAILVAPMFSQWYLGMHFADEIEANAAMVEGTENLPQMDPDSPRLRPAEVARNDMDSSFQFPQHSVGTQDITFVEQNGSRSMLWSAPIQPEGLRNQIQNQQAGVVFANASSLDKDVRSVEIDFECGEGMLVTDDYHWQLRKNDYMAKYTDPYIIPHDNSLRMAVPRVEHSWNIRMFPVPMVYAEPEFGGVDVIDPECNIEHYEPDEAQNADVLDGQNFYPYGLARARISAMSYRHGIWNALFVHREQPQIADLPGDNRQPFTIPTVNEGIQYQFAMEAHGSGGGIFSIYLMDARTGDVQRIGLNEGSGDSSTSSLVGPRSGPGFVRNEDPKVGWDKFETLEPLPIAHDGDLWWMYRVTGQERAGVSYFAFVNAANPENEIRRYPPDSRVTAFIAGENPPEGELESNPMAGEGDRQEQQQSNPQMIVVIRNQDGSTDETVGVGANQTVNIRTGPTNTTSSNQTNTTG